MKCLSKTCPIWVGLFANALHYRENIEELYEDRIIYKARKFEEGRCLRTNTACTCGRSHHLEEEIGGYEKESIFTASADHAFGSRREHIRKSLSQFGVGIRRLTCLPWKRQLRFMPR